ncbi:hypothetical protein FACS1894170_12300 [Planctomycetales bacterium]|nr:hypothetical protein FACS1894170_12300 [Planctomycetales bacterium]
MPIQPSTFFAMVLLIAALATNIIYFADFRESFLAGHGGSAPQQVENTPAVEETLPRRQANDAPKPVTDKPKPQVAESRVNLPLPPIPLTADPFLQPSSNKSGDEKVDKLPTKTEVPKPKPDIPVVKTVSATTAPAIPQAEPAKPAPAVASQFTPITNSGFNPNPLLQAPPLTTKIPTPTPVWTTVDSALEAPTRRLASHE